MFYSAIKYLKMPRLFMNLDKAVVCPIAIYPYFMKTLIKMDLQDMIMHSMRGV